MPAPANSDPLNAASHPVIPGAPGNLTVKNLELVYDGYGNVASYLGGVIDLHWDAVTVPGQTITYGVQRSEGFSGNWTLVAINVGTNS